MNVNATFHDGRVEIEGMEPVMIYGASREIFDRMVGALQKNIKSPDSAGATDNTESDAISALHVLVMEIDAYNKCNHLHTSEFIKESKGLGKARSVLKLAHIS